MIKKKSGVVGKGIQQSTLWSVSTHHYYGTILPSLNLLITNYNVEFL